MLAASRRGGMRNADRRNRTDTDHSQEWRASTGKPDAWKAGMSGLAEGPTEQGWATSTSPAAYSTWGGADGKGLGNQHLASGLLYLVHPSSGAKRAEPLGSP